MGKCEEDLAGRHLPRLREFGVKAGDAFDIEKVLCEYDSSKETDHQENSEQIGSSETNSKETDHQRNAEQMGSSKTNNKDTDHLESCGESNDQEGGLHESHDSDGDSDKENNGQMNLELITSINLEMYLPTDVIKDMSDAEKDAARNRIDNWLFLLKQGISAPFPTLVELLNKEKKPAARSRGKQSNVRSAASTSSATADIENRRSSRLSALTRPTNNSEPQDERSPRATTMPISISPLFCSTPAEKENGGSLSQTSKRLSTSPPPYHPTAAKKSATESAQEIPDHLKTFLKALNLDNSQKALIRNGILNPALHKFDIIPILKGKRGMDKILHHLQGGGCIFNKNLSDVLDELLQHISKKPFNILLVNPDMREGLAVSVVATFPQLAQPAIRIGDTPWTWLFDRANNTGKLSTVYRKHQKKAEIRPRGGGTDRRKVQPKPSSSCPERAPTSVDELHLSNDTKFLRQLSPVDSSKGEILRLMTNTYSERNKLVSRENMPIGVILDAYVHLKSFQGEMIDNDFELGNPGKKDNMLKNFQDMIPKLISIAKADVTKYPPEEVFLFRDESLNALLILSKYLPKPKRTHEYEKKMNPIAEIEDIFQTVPVGSNIAYEVTAKREKSKHPIQPYIIAVGSHHNIGRMYLVWGDGHSMELPRNCLPLRAIDFLIKAHFVLRTPYILGWKYALRFLQVHAYKIPPDSKRETAFTDKAMELLAFSRNVNNDSEEEL